MIDRPALRSRGQENVASSRSIHQMLPMKGVVWNRALTCNFPLGDIRAVRDRDFLRIQAAFEFRLSRPKECLRAREMPRLSSEYEYRIERQYRTLRPNLPGGSIRSSLCKTSSQLVL